MSICYKTDFIYISKILWKVPLHRNKQNTFTFMNKSEYQQRTYTHKEIFQQPKVWKAQYESMLNNRKQIQEYISKEINSKEHETILTGAGTSAFIGDILSVLFPLLGFTNCKSVATTDLITNPESFFPKHRKLILISFARSGNSPESIAAVEQANTLCKEVSHVIITCNPDGKLASTIGSNDLLLLLPPETNDVSLAMTSSFSTMLLSGLLFAEFNKIEENATFIDNLCRNGQYLLDNYPDSIKTLTKRNFSRAVFLGSDELKGVAEECHLKLQEMTDGNIICKFDSFLGFRHGPKAVINEDTLLIYLFSDSDYVLQYEKDLVEQINSNNRVVGQIAISQKKVEIPSVRFDLEVITTHNDFPKKNKYQFILHVFVGQLLGMFKSLEIGLNPDSPSVSGNISRVVEGVRIYNYIK